MTHVPLPHAPPLAAKGRKGVKKGSRPALPAPIIVGLPVSYRKSARFGTLPVVPGLGNRLVIAAVEQQYNAIVLLDILRQRRPVDQEAHRRGVRIMVLHRQQHRLIRSGRLTKRSVGKKAVLAKRPQVSIERVDALL